MIGIIKWLPFIKYYIIISLSYYNSPVSDCPHFADEDIMVSEKNTEVT